MIMDNKLKKLKDYESPETQVLDTSCASLLCSSNNELMLFTEVDVDQYVYEETVDVAFE